MGYKRESRGRRCLKPTGANHSVRRRLRVNSVKSAAGDVYESPPTPHPALDASRDLALRMNFARSLSLKSLSRSLARVMAT